MLKEMKAHPEKKFARRGWNGKGIYIQLQVPDKYSMMTLPYIYMVTDNLKSDNPDAPRGRVPWLASQTDMLSDDWVEVGSAPSGDPRPSYPLCDEVRSTLEVNSDLAIDCMKDKTFRVRSLGPRVYFTEMDAESIIKFLKMCTGKEPIPDYQLDPMKKSVCAHTMKEIQDYKFDNQPNPKKYDAVKNPAHYCAGRKIEPWDVMIDWDLKSPVDHAIKYIARAGRKQQPGMTMKQSEEQDLMKAINCLQKRLEVLRGSDDNRGGA